jgi:phage tail sheath gpL-like
MVDASAVASVLGITTSYEDMRAGGVLFLPMRIALFAQGKSGTSYSTDKWTATSAAAAGTKYGFGSPIHLALRELLPANGDGVGTIPVDVFPLEDAGGSDAPAVGSIVPSGTAAKAASYRARISGYLSDAFVIDAGALATAANLHTALRRMGAAISARPEMPVTVGYTYGTVTAGAITGTGNGTLTALSVHAGRTPKPGVWTLKVVTAVINGGVWSLTDPDGVVVEAALTQTVGAGSVTAFSDKGGLDFTITDGSTDFALNATFTITVPATDVTLTANWTGESGNDLYIEVIDAEQGLTFAITQPAGGLINPSVAAALGRVGNVWEPLGLNCLNIEDTTNLDRYKDWGEGRWGELVHKPIMVFTGNTEAAVEDAIEVCSVRQDDRINAQLVAPGSPNLPFVVAARELARIAKVANNNPPVSYNAQRATGLLPGTDEQQWDYLSKDIAVKAGSSTVDVVDGVVQLQDIITFWRPTGEEPPAWRYVCDVIKVMNVVFNVNLIFAAPEWAAAPLIPDDQPTVNPAARKPKSAKAAVNVMLGNLGLQAIIADADAAKKLTTAVINSQNPKRLDVGIKFAISGNTLIKDVNLRWGFFFPALAAA